MPLDTDALKAFTAVARCGSFSLAAERLHLTQPAVSKRIASLEASLDAVLFDRLGRRPKLTEAGAALLPRADAILAQLDEARRAMADLGGEVRGVLRLCTSHHVGLHKLPPILRRFTSRYPDVNLQIQFVDSEIAHERVLRGDCELAVVTLAPVPNETLLTEALWLDPLVFVCHPSADIVSPTSLQRLSGEAAILPDLNTYTGRLVKAVFDRHQLPLTLNMTTNYLETIKMMVSVGLGWSLLPASMLDGQIRELQVPQASLSRTLGVVRHKRRSFSNAATAFYAMLTQERHTE